MSVCVVPVRTAVIFLEPHGRHPHMGVTVTRHPELLEHEAMAGAACANPPCTTTTSRGSNLVCVWQGYRVFQLAVVQGVMPRSVSAAGSWWPVSVLISRAGGWLGGAGLLRPGHLTQVAARSQPSRAPASSQPAQAALSMQTRNVGHHFVLLQIICWIDH